MDTAQHNLFDFDRARMESFVAGLGEKVFHATQILQWIHRHGIRDFDAMTNLSKSLRERLKYQTQLPLPQITEHLVSRDGTQKWRLLVDKDNQIEMVFIPEQSRGTLCISSQVGCALKCSFCATGAQGFSRNLNTGEIIAQVWLAKHFLERVPATHPVVTNVVLMGMGEPLLNFENVVTAIDIMLDDNTYGLSRRRVTLSTAGVVPRIDELRARCPVSLAVSLHAPDDALRDQLVPINRKYPIQDLIAACRRYVTRNPKRQITFEYVLLDGINDSIHHARRLARLLRDLPAKINLIPFNPFPYGRYRCSKPEVIEQFRARLLAEGLMTITRKTRGDDIAGACGQLAGLVKPRARRMAQQRDASCSLDPGQAMAP